jgi:hypothetical protein
MTLLRILRNFAVLVILTVGAFGLIPRPVAAQSTCEPLGARCAYPPWQNSQCCSGLCGPHGTCCDKPLRNQYCTSSLECCSGFCMANEHGIQGGHCE